MHIPQHFKPNDNFPANSTAHFKQAISILIQETTKFSDSFASFTHIQDEISKFQNATFDKMKHKIKKVFVKISWQKTRAGIASYDAGFAAIRSKGSIDSES